MLTPTGKSDKHGSVFFNGRLGPWWRVAAVIFACGVLWAKVNSLESRVGNIERILMASAKGTS